MHKIITLEKLKEEYMNKNELKKKVLKTLLLSIVSLTFISCSNLFDNGNTSSEQSEISGKQKTLTITGIIKLPEELTGSGAIPEEYKCLFDSMNTAEARTAFPLVPAGSYYVTATSGSQVISSENTTDPITITSPSTGATFSMTLPIDETETTWTIEAGFKANFNGSTVIILKDSDDVTISATTPTFSHDFHIKPLAIDANSKGNVSLIIDYETSEMADELELYFGSTKITADSTKGETLSPTLISLKNYTAGSYKAKLVFKKNHYVVFTDYQGINIFPNMTTSRWVNNGGTSPITASNEYCVRNSDIQDYLITQIYVGNTTIGGTTITASDTTGNGTVFAPFETIEPAISYLQTYGDQNKDYTIWISGEITGAQTISDGSATSPTPVKAKSLTISGVTGNTSDSLKGGSSGSVLYLDTSKPVKITNLTITGGKGTAVDSKLYGGGIYINKGSVELTTGVVVDGNTADVGGGVYLADGTLYLNDTAVVGKPISALGTNPTRAGTTSGTYANKATQSGGGIEVYEGTLWLGYRPPAQNETQPQALTTSGGVIYNLVAGTAETHGGGIDNNHGTLNIAHGFVSYNYAFCESGYTKDGCGGGVTTADAMYLLGDATISHNESAYGGAVYISKGRDGRHGYFTMSGGTIESNASYKQNGIDGDGGGIAIGASGSFEMSGGTIQLNTAESRGGAIFHNGSLCKISGGTNCTATIPEGDGTNNIFLIKNGQTITLEGSTGHTGTGEIAVTAQLASRGVTVLTGNGVADYYSKFKLTSAYGMGIKNTGKIDLDVIVTDIYVNKNATAANSFTPAAGSYTINDSTWNNSTYAFNASATSSQTKPFTSIETALKFITYQASEQDYTIHIVGTYTVASSTEINITNNSSSTNPITLVKTATQTNPTVTAKSITIEGVTDVSNPPIISGANNYRCLSIATEVPVIISNISIINGYFNGNSYGAGITIDAQNGPRKSDVTLSTGAIIKSNSGTRAGAIYNFGTLTIAGAQISDNSATDTSYGNGGAIRNEGGIVNIYGDTTIIGAAGDETTGYALNVTTPTKKYSNYAGKYGGAIYNDLCSYNGNTYYGEINIGKDAENNYSSPKIEYNYSEVRGGGIFNFSNCIINFYGGSVSYCTAGVYGGGIYNEGKLSLKQAARTKTIKTNNAYAGGAVCEYGENASFTITPYTSNAAYISIPCSDSGINSENTIYLGTKSGSNPCQITITGLLQYGCDSMRIDTDFSTFKGKPVITTSNDYTPSLNDYNISLGKFVIKQPSGSKYSYYYSSEKQTTDPKICQTSCIYPTLLSNITSASVGDIVMIDGDIIKYEAGLKLGTKASDAVAIIFHNGTSLGGSTRVLGMAADLSTLKNYNWANSNPASDIPNLKAYVSGTNFSGTSTSYDGSSNYNYASTNSPSTIFEAMRYCANYKNYKANLGGTTYESGWYLPSIRELYKVYENITTINAVFTNALGRSMEAYTYLGGTSSLGGAGGVRYVPYWSSNTEEYGSGDLKIWCVYLGNIKDGDTRITAHVYNYYGNSADGGAVLPIRQFN